MIERNFFKLSKLKLLLSDYTVAHFDSSNALIVSELSPVVHSHLEDR
jgi:hypothetical protein